MSVHVYGSLYALFFFWKGAEGSEKNAGLKLANLIVEQKKKKNLYKQYEQ